MLQPVPVVGNAGFYYLASSIAALRYSKLWSFPTNGTIPNIFADNYKASPEWI